MSWGSHHPVCCADTLLRELPPPRPYGAPLLGQEGSDLLLPSFSSKGGVSGRVVETVYSRMRILLFGLAPAPRSFTKVSTQLGRAAPDATSFT